MPRCSRSTVAEVQEPENVAAHAAGAVPAWERHQCRHTPGAAGRVRPPSPPGGCSCAGTIFGGHRLSQPFTTFSLPFIVALPAGGRPQQQTSSWSTATVTSSVRRSPASTLISRRCVTALFLDLPLRHCRFHCLFLTSQCLDVALVFPLLRARTTDSSSVSMPCFPLMMAAAR